MYVCVLCMYVCMYVLCTYACMYVYMYVYVYVYICICMYVCMYMHVCTYVCMHETGHRLKQCCTFEKFPTPSSCSMVNSLMLSLSFRSAMRTEASFWFLTSLIFLWTDESEGLMADAFANAADASSNLG
jgi:hypothetical protein